jgi:hypothetical protein
MQDTQLAGRVHGEAGDQFVVGLGGILRGAGQHEINSLGAKPAGCSIIHHGLRGGQGEPGNLGKLPSIPRVGMVRKMTSGYHSASLAATR